MLKNMLTGSLAVVLALGVARAHAEGPACPKKAVEPAKEPYEVNLHIVSDGPAVEIKLGCRSGTGVPCKSGCAHLGGGNIVVEQPSPDTIVVRLGGAACACGSPLCGAHAGFSFDVSQCFEIVNHGDKGVKLIMEGDLVGLLRSHGKSGSAQTAEACGAVSVGTPECSQEILSVCMPPHSVACGENKSINDHQGPMCVPVLPGCYTLHTVFGFSASQPCGLKLCKAPSAEFAEGALDPLWISACEPFYGARKDHQGFTITLRVEEVDCGNGNGVQPEQIDLPKLEEEKVIEKIKAKGISLKVR